VTWKKQSPITVIAVLLLGAHIIATAILPPRGYLLTVVGNVFPLVCGLLLIALCWRNSRHAARTVRIFWLLMAASFVVHVMSQLYFSYFEVLVREEVSGPWGDCLFFLLAVPLLAALSACPHSETVSGKLRFRYLDLVILLLWWLCLYSYFALPWNVVIDDPVKFTTTNNALLMTEHSVVLCILGYYGWKSAGAWKRFYAQFFGAFLTFAAGGYLQNAVAASSNQYYSGGWYDVPLNVGFVWFVLLAENARDLKPEPAASFHKPAAPGLRSARLAMLAMLSLPLLAAAGFLSSGVPASITNFRLRLICSAILVLGSLVFVRLHFSEREIARLAKMAQSSVERLKSVQARISQSQKMAALGRLAAGAAHEINNPLTAIMGYAELLRDDATLTTEEVRAADKIKDEVRRAQGAILSFRQFGGTAETPLAPKTPSAPAE
jgi:His Kinase A (phospho-acceptor) domain